MGTEQAAGDGEAEAGAAGAAVARPTTRRGEALPHDRVSVEVVIPVSNEEATVARNVTALCDYLETYLPYRWQVTMTDDASTDRTLAVTQELALEPRVGVLHLDRKGRGRTLRAAGLASEADVVTYMDVDLSTSLQSFLPLIALLVAGHSDVAIGSRLLKGAVVTRQWKREVFPAPTTTIKLMFRNGFSDAQCGFKVLTRRPRPAAGRREQRVVPRHGAATAGGGERLPRPRGGGRVGRGPRLPGRHRGDGAQGPEGAVPGSDAAGAPLADAASTGRLCRRERPFASVRSAKVER